MISVLSVIVLLGVLIFVHELGHFLTAKLAGVGVLKFSLGFGPRLIGKKIGETEYLLSLIPLGGYVKLLGESEDDELADEDRKRSFMGQSVWKRMGIVATGPIFNFFLAIAIFTFVYSWGVPVLISKIGSIQPGTAAYDAGLKKNDIITNIDDTPVTRWTDMAEIIGSSDGRILNITIIRGEKSITIPVRPTLFKVKNIFGEDADSFKIGISPSRETAIEKHNPFGAFIEAIKQTWLVSKLTVMSLVKIIEGVISPRTLGGPIMIAQLADAQAKEGLVPFILFMALLSVNLAVLNLLPIPILDGGHIFFYFIEIITGKEVNIKWRERAQQVGFVFLVLLMIFVIVMDIDRLNIKFMPNIDKYFSK